MLYKMVVNVNVKIIVGVSEMYMMNCILVLIFVCDSVVKMMVLIRLGMK